MLTEHEWNIQSFNYDKILNKREIYMNYKVIQKHKGNYPNPISLKKGKFIIIGNKYKGPENWNN
ncbi:hypothetical protein CN445_30585 [Bacillus cereus]|nr:hypothetical protein CN445_30585 [Bacillus cereus]